MAVSNKISKGYGIGSPTLNVFPEPIIAQRAPRTNDFAEIGTVWVDQANDNVYVISKVSGNSATWVTAGGDAVSFTTVTTTGKITAGDSFEMSAGTATITADDNVARCIYLHANAGTSETIHIHSDQGTQATSIYLESDAGGIAIDSGSAADDSIELNSYTNNGGIKLTTYGNLTVTSASGTAAGVAAITLNAKVGVATFTGGTTASGATQTFTITNDQITEGCGILVTVSNNGTNDAKITLERVKTAAGSMLVMTKNNGADALNGDVIISWMMLFT